MVGDSTIADKLRVSSCLELFLNSNFYLNHPNFFYFLNLFPEHFKKLDNIFSCAISSQPADGVPYSEDLIVTEAIGKCSNKTWASYVCILALSSVINFRIRVHRPILDLREIPYEIIFNSMVLPRSFYEENFVGNHKDWLDILFCRESDGDVMNHFVPLITLGKYRFENQVKNLKRSANDQTPIQSKIRFEPLPKKPSFPTTKSSSTQAFKKQSQKFSKKKSTPFQGNTIYDSFSKKSVDSSSTVVTSSCSVVTTSSQTILTTVSNSTSLSLTTSLSNVISTSKVLSHPLLSSKKSLFSSKLTSSKPFTNIATHPIFSTAAKAATIPHVDLDISTSPSNSKPEVSNFPISEPNIFISSPNEGSHVPISFPSESGVPISSPSEPRVPKTFPSEPDFPISSPSEAGVTISSPIEPDVPISVPSEPGVAISSSCELRVPISSPIEAGKAPVFHSSASKTLDSPKISTSDSKPRFYSDVPLSDRYDIAFYFSISKNLTNEERYDLLKNCFQPDTNFRFPTIEKKTFDKKYLANYDWARYSKSLNGAFCIHCSLFACFSQRFSTHTNFISKVVCPGPSLATAFKRHIGNNPKCVNQTLHEECKALSLSFQNRFEGKAKDVDMLIDKENQKAIEKAKKILPSIIDTVVVCGHMGISLRGHRDERRNHPFPGEYSCKAGLGNFVELVNFGIRRGDEILKDHYESAPLNAHYLSPTTQNEFISISGALILEKILIQVKPSEDYSYFFFRYLLMRQWTVLKKSNFL